MQAIEFLKSQFGRGRRSTIQVSIKLGKEQTYINSMLRRKGNPQSDNFAMVLDAIGYDLIARNRETGEETIIDPPPTIDELVKQLE